MTASIDIYEAKAVLKEVYEAIQTVQENLAYLSQILNQPPQTPPTQPQPQRAKNVAYNSNPAGPQPTQQQPFHNAPQNQTSTVQDIRMMFPEDLDEKLHFTEKPDYIIIAPKQFLGSENFAKIASTVRRLGGAYISAGRDSHFRVYKSKQGGSQ